MIREPARRRFTLDQWDEGERMAYLVQLLPQQVAEPGKALIGRSNPDRRSSISFPRAEPQASIQLHSAKPSTCGWTLTAVIGDVLEFLIPKPCAGGHARV